MTRRSFSFPLVALLAAAGCSGLIGDGPGDDSTESPTGTQQPLCSDDAAVSVGTAPLRRLTQLEYNNSVRDLLGIDTALGGEFAADTTVAGFAANSVAAMSELELSDYLAASETLAEQALAAHQAEWLACDVTQTDCVRPFIQQLGRRAFRRSLSAELEASLVALYESARSQWDADKGVQLTLMAILNSPHFLYHLELSAPAAGEQVVALDGFEVASRMSYFLWHSLPDDALLAAAETGALSSPEGIEIEARRMLADPKAERAIETFHDQWLELEVLSEVMKDPALYPEWSETMAASARSETLTFVSDVIAQGGDVAQLFTASHSFVDAELAALYGVSASPPAGELVRVELDPAERAGILTQAAFLASRAHAAEVSWVLRGKFVRERLLCETIPAPPPNVNQMQANDPNRLTSPECGSCHQMMDPIGYGFDNYDAIGRFRTVDEAGDPISGEGEVVDPAGTLGIGTFTGAVELASELAASDQLRHCIATQWFRYAARRAETQADGCTIERAYEDFKSAGFAVEELLVAITKGDAFRHKSAEAQ